MRNKCGLPLSRRASLNIEIKLGLEEWLCFGQASRMVRSRMKGREGRESLQLKGYHLSTLPGRDLGELGGHEQGWLVSCCCCKVLWFTLPKSQFFLRPKKMDDEYVLVCKMGDLGPMRHLSSSEFSMKQWKLYLKNVKGVATIPVGVDIMAGWIEALGY